jgi:choline dehydrogenase
LQAEVSVPKDTNDGNANGLFWLLRSEDPDSGTRSYARTAHYERVKNIRPNYHLLPSTAVSKVLFKNKKAVGVQFVTRADGTVGNATAKKEVIIAAGAVHSPHILHLSGIGPKAVVQNLGVPLVSELPGVGANLQDHLVLRATYDCEYLFTVRCMA